MKTMTWVAVGGYGLTVVLLALAIYMAASTPSDPKHWFCPSCDQIPVFLTWAGRALYVACITSAILILAWAGSRVEREQQHDSAVE